MSDRYLRQLLRQAQQGQVALTDYVAAALRVAPPEEVISDLRGFDIKAIRLAVKLVWIPIYATQSKENKARVALAGVLGDVVSSRVVHSRLRNTFPTLPFVVRNQSLLSDADWRLFAADCAEHVLHYFESVYPNDDRPRKAIETARRYARGEATAQELDAAESAAWSAETAAESAAESAAEDVTQAAALSAAGSADAAAWAAARSAAKSAAWVAARSAAKSAAKSAAWVAAKSVAYLTSDPELTEWQLAYNEALRQYQLLFITKYLGVKRPLSLPTALFLVVVTSPTRARRIASSTLKCPPTSCRLCNKRPRTKKTSALRLQVKLILSTVES